MYFHWLSLTIAFCLLPTGSSNRFDEISNQTKRIRHRLLPHNEVLHNSMLDQHEDGKLIGIRGDIVVRLSSVQHRQLTDAASNTHDLLQFRTFSKNNLSPGRNHLWEDIWPTVDGYKDSDSVWDKSTLRPTLNKYHMIVLPIWWADETQDNDFDPTYVSDMFEQVRNYYLDMSWGKHEMSWEIWDRIVLEGVTLANADFDNSEKAARSYVASQNRIEFTDYSGIVLMYNTIPRESSPFSFAGGWGGVNANFLWISIPGWFDVTRHEIGHNYGHPHHLTNTYQWRFSRGTTEFDYDGFDMMSGGNGYPISDFAAASKWFFNWIPDDAVVMMQPEGSTSYCPKCVSQITKLTLRPFDSRTVSPSSKNKMAVHIPITAITNEWGEKKIYSYWLSYRGSGADGISSAGLSVHVSWFTLSGLFGASYDSLNYDVFGDTTTKFDSFVVPGTCYIITPSGLMNDVDPLSTEQIQPVACVNSVSRNSSITISVSFVNSTNLPPATVVFSSQRQLNCSRDGSRSGMISLTMPQGSVHLIHYKGTGANGTVQLSLCRRGRLSPTATAYFYDSFPIAYTSFNSPPGYGAYKSMNVTKLCSNRNRLTYSSEYDETYVLVVRNKGSSSLQTRPVLFSSTCFAGSCSNNHYLNEFGECQECPPGSVSSKGAESLSDCISCSVDGMVVEHPKSSNCMMPLNFVPFTLPATEWRLFTFASSTETGWNWDVRNIRLFSSNTCSPSSRILTKNGVAIESGNAGGGWEASGAFINNDGVWGGRPDERNYFWIGWDFLTNVSVRCVEFNHPNSNKANELWLQARQQGTSDWKNVVFASALIEGENRIAV